ncbi:unnamed protein product [Leptidea sinapis]|uniref:Endothelin-converting enzyme 1 n=1 Tax=Leptidea sinapis TaxID=189913 RepID=A0A5E4Q233_9NEOP|nr:unnamed protein product [Leptidea sinapis]
MKYKVRDADSDSQRPSDMGLEEKLERTIRCSSVLIISLAGCLVLLGVYTAVLLITEHTNPPPCLTEACVTTSSRVLSALNKDISPCTDFYEFACGGWIKKNPVPEWATSWDQLAKLREQLTVDLRDLLEAGDEPNSPKSVLKAKALYRTCVDTEKMEVGGIKPIENLLQSLGLPTRPPSEASANLTWEEVAGRARRRLGLNVLVSVQVAEDVRNTSRNRVVLEQVTPGFSERYLLQPEQFAQEISQYRTYIREMITVVDPLTNASVFSDDIIDFSKALAKIMTPMEVRRSGTHLFHDVSVSQFVNGSSTAPAEWQQHDWRGYLELVFSNTSVELSPHEDRLIVMDLPYLQKLATLLSETKPVLIERYMWWSVFSTVSPMTLQRFRDLGFEFSRNVFGLRQRAPRWKSCTANINANFEMVEDVREAFAATVRDLDWMDGSTRERTLRKLRAIRNFVGFPAWLLSPDKLDKHYDHAEVVEGNLFESFLKLTNTAVKKSFESLREKPDRNSVPCWNIAAAILRKRALNYGSIGAIMGHEVTHGFDDQGRRYDEEGNLSQWWSAATLEHYHSKVQCIIQQYSQYHLPQLPNYTVHGFNTQGENIADNGGLRAALHAYSLHAARRAPARRLPALPYTDTQLFFLGFAQIWCGNSTVGALKSKMVEGVHSPNKIRVIGTLSNFKEFADAWQCPSGSPMNPEHKCVLW